jgi:hypothetical protein
MGQFLNFFAFNVRNVAKARAELSPPIIQSVFARINPSG